MTDLRAKNSATIMYVTGFNFKISFMVRKVSGCFEKRTPSLKTGMDVENSIFWFEIR